jgi:hypothetical protein
VPLTSAQPSARGTAPPGHAARDQGAEDAADAGDRGEQADDNWRQPDDTYEENDQERRVAGERKVGDGPEDTQLPQERVAQDQQQSICDLPPQRATTTRRGRSLRGRVTRSSGRTAGTEQACRGHHETDGVKEQRRDGAEQLSDQASQARPGEGRRGRAALHFRVALDQLLGRDHRWQVDLVRSHEQDTGRPREQLNDDDQARGQDARSGRDGHAGVQGGRYDVARDHHPPGGQAIYPAPAGSPMTSQGSHAAAVSTLTASVLACSTVTATSGTPTMAIALPTLLTVSPIHSSRNVRCHSRPPCL